jgi:hypothetical protein
MTQISQMKKIEEGMREMKRNRLDKSYPFTAHFNLFGLSSVTNER